jgi:hypothetical protein
VTYTGAGGGGGIITVVTIGVGAAPMIVVVIVPGEPRDVYQYTMQYVLFCKTYQSGISTDCSRRVVDMELDNTILLGHHKGLDLEVLEAQR